MQLTKFTHSCVRIDDGDRALVIDPGAFSELDQAFDGISTVLITHEHFDHVVPEKLLAAAQANGDMRVWGPASLSEQLAPLGERFTAVGAGEKFSAGGFEVQSFGGQHALIHGSIPVVSNVAFLVDGIYHPGDSFTVPNAPVETLLVPVHAPWSKLGEVIDFVQAVRAPKAIGIHDALLSEIGLMVAGNMLPPSAAAFGCEYQQVAAVSTIDI